MRPIETDVYGHAGQNMRETLLIGIQAGVNEVT